MRISENIAICNEVNRINSHLLCYGHATVDAGWHGTVVPPVFSRLYFIINGSFSIKGKDGNELTLHKGNWYLIPAGYSFTYKCDEEMEHFYTHVKLCDMDGIDLLRNCKQPICLNSDNVDSEKIISLTNSSSIADGLILRQAITEILLIFAKEYNISITTNDYSTVIYNAINYIKQNLTMQLTIPEIANACFVSKSTLTKHFKKELALSVNEYILSTVMAEAEKLLTSTNISIHEISDKLGFSDQFYFSRRFKDNFGKSPREYRKKQAL